MKVKTNLISGSLWNDVANLSNQSIQAAVHFVERADQQTNQMVGSVIKAGQSTWGSLRGLFSSR